MVIPEISVLVNHAKNIVSNAAEKGELNSLTHRIVRTEIEKQLSLSKGILDTSEYRKPLKSAITAAVEEGRAKRPTTRPVSVTKHSDADEVRQIKKKPPPKPRSEKQASTNKEDGLKAHKSAEFVMSDADSEDENTKTSSKLTAIHKNNVLVLSDEESEGGGGGHRSNKLAVTGTKRVIPDSRRTDETNASGKAIGSREKRVLTSGDGGEISDTNVGSSKSKEANEKSDTELSDLIDEPPKKKRTSNSQVKPLSREKTQATKKKSIEPADKDEETIKRLKSLVAACGIRKVWSKVFEGLDKSSQKIRKLKEILSDLGMKGRFSMEQAKAIRAKRELAQELEDVQTFERAVHRKGEKKRHVAGSESEDEDEEPKPKRRKENARQSIMAFLQDQSESE